MSLDYVQRARPISRHVVKAQTSTRCKRAECVARSLSWLQTVALQRNFRVINVNSNKIWSLNNILLLTCSFHSIRSIKPADGSLNDKCLPPTIELKSHKYIDPIFLKSRGERQGWTKFLGLIQTCEKCRTNWDEFMFK